MTLNLPETVAVGGLAGVIAAPRVKMTDMPQLVSLFNAVGGAALIAFGDAASYAGSQSLTDRIPGAVAALDGMSLGSVAHAVLHHLPCPVPVNHGTAL